MEENPQQFLEVRIPPDSKEGWLEVSKNTTDLVDSNFTGNIFIRGAHLPVFNENPEGFSEVLKQIKEVAPSQKLFFDHFDISALPLDVQKLVCEAIRWNDVSFDQCSFEGVDLSKLKISYAKFLDCNLNRASFEDALLKGVEFKGSGAHRGSPGSSTPSYLQERGEAYSGPSAGYTTNTQLNNANFHKTTLMEVTFENTDCHGATFNRAIFTDPVFHNPGLSGVDLRDSIVSNANEKRPRPILEIVDSLINNDQWNQYFGRHTPDEIVLLNSNASNESSRPVAKPEKPSGPKSYPVALVYRGKDGSLYVKHISPESNVTFDTQLKNNVHAKILSLPPDDKINKIKPSFVKDIEGPWVFIKSDELKGSDSLCLIRSYKELVRRGPHNYVEGKRIQSAKIPIDQIPANEGLYAVWYTPDNGGIFNSDSSNLAPTTYIDENGVEHIAITPHELYEIAQQNANLLDALRGEDLEQAELLFSNNNRNVQCWFAKGTSAFDTRVALREVLYGKLTEGEKSDLKNEKAKSIELTRTYESPKKPGNQVGYVYIDKDGHIYIIATRPTKGMEKNKRHTLSPSYPESKVPIDAMVMPITPSDLTLDQESWFVLNGKLPETLELNKHNSSGELSGEPVKIPINLLPTTSGVYVLWQRDLYPKNVDSILPAFFSYGEEKQYPVATYDLFHFLYDHGEYEKIKYASDTQKAKYIKGVLMATELIISKAGSSSHFHLENTDDPIFSKDGMYDEVELMKRITFVVNKPTTFLVNEPISKEADMTVKMMTWLSVSDMFAKDKEKFLSELKEHQNKGDNTGKERAMYAVIAKHGIEAIDEAHLNPENLSEALLGIANILKDAQRKNSQSLIEELTNTRKIIQKKFISLTVKFAEEKGYLIKGDSQYDKFVSGIISRILIGESIKEEQMESIVLEVFDSLST